MIFYFQNAFPVSGQLYTTHLLSLEALLTVIDSTEAHCQAKILRNTLQQDKKETGKTTVDNSEKSLESLNGKVNVSPNVLFSLLVCVPVFNDTFLILVQRSNIFISGSEHAVESTTVITSTESKGAPTSGHLMADKMSLGIQEAESACTGGWLS